jgi:hypothetical protein
VTTAVRRRRTAETGDTAAIDAVIVTGSGEDLRMTDQKWIETLFTRVE